MSLNLGLGIYLKNYSRVSGAADVTAPVLTLPTDAANGANGANIGVTTDEGNGALYWFISTSGTPPTAANLKTGTGATSFGNQAVSATGVQSASPTGLAGSTSYFAHFLQRDAAGNDSAIVSGDGFTTSAAADTTPPTLTSPVGTQTGDTTATVGATTNEANGTMYAVVSTSATPPTAAQVEAGQNATGAAAIYAGNQAITTTGAKTFSATGLTASTTYYAYIMHKDAAGNRSTVASSASFTTTITIPAPVLTKTSASGVNPMAWDGYYADLQVGDVIRLSWTVNGGAATTETHTVTSDDILGASEGSYSFTWAAFASATSAFVNGDVITVKERIERSGVNSAYSNILSDTVASVTPSTWATSTGANKSQYVTVNGTGNLVATGQGGFNNAPISVRASQARSGKRQFQVTISATPSKMWLGVDDGTDNLADTGTTNFSRPGLDNASGVSLKFDGFGYAIYAGGSSTPVSTNGFAGGAGSSVSGDIITCEYDSTAGTVSFYNTHSGTTIQLGSTVTGISLGSWYADVGFEDATAATALFGSGQARTLTSGYGFYDS